MKISLQYTIKNIVAIIFQCFLWVMLFVALIDFVSQSQKLTADYAWLSALEYVLLMLPSRIGTCLPIIMLISGNLLVLRWRQNQEWLALQSLGCSYWQMLRLLFLTSFVISLFFIFIAENFGPDSLFKAKQMRAKTQNVLLNHSGLWWWGKASQDERLLNYIEPTDIDNKFGRVFVLSFLQKTKKIDRVIVASNAEFSGDKWLLKKAKIHYVSSGLKIEKNTLVVDWHISAQVLNSLRKTDRMLSLPMLYQRWQFAEMSSDYNGSSYFQQFLHRLFLPFVAALLFCLTFAGIAESLYFIKNKIKLLGLVILGLVVCFVDLWLEFLVNILSFKAAVFVLLALFLMAWKKRLVNGINKK